MLTLLHITHVAFTGPFVHVCPSPEYPVDSHATRQLLLLLVDMPQELTDIVKLLVSLVVKQV